MRNQRCLFGRLRIIGLGLLLLCTLITGCGRDKGQTDQEIVLQPYNEPYTGPCPAGQSSWDCFAWNQDNWE